MIPCRSVDGASKCNTILGAEAHKDHAPHSDYK